MTEGNTLRIFPILSDNNLKYIPEAHCYLKFKNERIDVTSATSDFKKIEKYILEEIKIDPNQFQNLR